MVGYWPDVSIRGVNYGGKMVTYFFFAQLQAGIKRKVTKEYKKARKPRMAHKKRTNIGGGNAFASHLGMVSRVAREFKSRG